MNGNKIVLLLKKIIVTLFLKTKKNQNAMLAAPSLKIYTRGSEAAGLDFTTEKHKPVSTGQKMSPSLTGRVSCAHSSLNPLQACALEQLPQQAWNDDTGALNILPRA